MIYRFHDNNNTGRLIPRITEFSTIENILILKLETENNCNVEMLKYDDRALLDNDINLLVWKMNEFYDSQKEPMGFQTDAVGYKEDVLTDEEDEYIEDRVGFV